MSNSDYLLALKLQQEFNKELTNDDDNDVQITSKFANSPTATPIKNRKRKIAEIHHQSDKCDLNATQNIVHPEWEVVDPTPDIYALFGAFDRKFFNNKLQCVTLEWSKKMYSCAGICYQRRNHMGKECIIRLSEPLLKLRQRKDLVETLLHEMIHAYLFVLNIREGNGGHGPNFKRIMTSINTTAGTNITVYHSFYDEVNLYKTHVWRCNGLCQHRKPFFGYVKRTSNRAPGPNDTWWAQHSAICGGYFAKISEPEPKRPKKENKKSAINGLQKINHPKWGITSAASKTITIPATTTTSARPKSYSDVPLQSPPHHRRSVFDSSAGKNLTNVVGFKDLTSDDDDDGPSRKTLSKPIISGAGHTLGGNGSTLPPLSKLRDIWSNKYPPTTNSQQTDEPAKLRSVSVTESKSLWEDIDDDVAVLEVNNTIIALSDSEDDNDHEQKPFPNMRANRKLTACERTKTIKEELLEEDENDSDIELIDDEYDDHHQGSVSVELADTSVIDDIFGTDTLMSDFNNINAVTMKDYENRGRPEREIISCPICQEKMCREILSDHLNGCLGITIKLSAVNRVKKSGRVKFSGGKKTTKSPLTEREVLAQAGYTNDVIERVLKEKEEELQYNRRIINEMASERLEQQQQQQESVAVVVKKHPCPVCSALFKDDEMNDHLDVCLNNTFNEDDD